MKGSEGSLGLLDVVCRVVAIVCLVCFLALGAELRSQTVVMPVSGHGDTTMSYAEVYDDGGPNGAYSNYCNSSYTFHTVHPQGRYKIQIVSQLTHLPGNALLQVRDGAATNSIVLRSSPPSINETFYSSSNAVTLTFTADDDFPTEGFEVILCEYDNPMPEGFAGIYLDSNTYRICWENSDPPVTWVVDYAIVEQGVSLGSFFADSSNFDVIVTDSTCLTFYDIPVGHRLVYRINPVFYSASSICPRTFAGQAQPYEPPYECPCVMPGNVSLELLADSVVIRWTGDDTVSFWHLYCEYYLIDTLLDGSVHEYVMPYDYPCFVTSVFLNGNCLTQLCNGVYASLPIGGCTLTVGYIERVATTGHSVTLRWNAPTDTQARYLLYYRRQGQSEGANVLVDTLAYEETTYTVEGLQPHTCYVFTVKVLCADGSEGCYATTGTISTTLDNCIDFINFFDLEHVHCMTGTYSHPSAYTGRDFNRHVAIVDTTMYDANTGNLLRCIPPGEEASFRLGDDDIGAQGESVTYDYVVDSLDKDMLVLKYAVVMQNSNHSSINQPHVTLEILDNMGMLIDTMCCYANFYAAGDLGWNSVPGTNIIWKDWTTVGIDIAPYHGQQIKIRFTTTDCADGGHFGYAYFNIRCDSKQIDLVNLCDGEDSINLRAPLGFVYRWTRGDDTTTFSTANEIRVPADETHYHCHVTFIGNPACSFTLHSIAVLPVLNADIYYEIDTCAQQLRLYSNSKILIDEEYLPYVHQTIENQTWIVNGDTLRGDSVVVDIEANGVNAIQFSCNLTKSSCGDTVVDSVLIAIDHRRRIEGPAVVCQGDTVTLTAVPVELEHATVEWDDGSTMAERTLVVGSDTTVWMVSNYLTCSDTLQHHIAVYPFFDDTVAFEMCPIVGDTMGFVVTQTGVYTHLATDRNGCDSLMTIDVVLHPAYYDTVRVETCGESFSNEEFSVDTTGFYTHVYSTVMGCDSMYHLDFVRHETSSDTIRWQILADEFYNEYDFHENREGMYTHTYVDQFGCDSLMNLDLSVIYLRFPNAVTPNGDGYNDRMEINNLLEAYIFSYNCLWVYDRWGRLIVKKENMRCDADFWDPNETDTPDGTYFYRFVARTQDRIIDHKSVIEVIR